MVLKLISYPPKNYQPPVRKAKVERQKARIEGGKMKRPLTGIFLLFATLNVPFSLASHCFPS
jgi:hypothetical protein